MNDYILKTNSVMLKVSGHFLPHATCLFIDPRLMVLECNVYKNHEGAWKKCRYSGLNFIWLVWMEPRDLHFKGIQSDSEIGGYGVYSGNIPLDSVFSLI